MKKQFQPDYIIYKGAENFKVHSLKEASVLFGMNTKNVSKHLSTGKPNKKGWYIVREYKPQLEIEGVFDLSESNMSVKEFESRLNAFLNSLDVVLAGNMYQLDNYGRRILK